MSDMLPVKYAALGSAALGPVIGAVPYLVYLTVTVASREDTLGMMAILKAVGIVAFYTPIVVIAAYVSAVVPAAIVGGGYAYLLNQRPSISQNRLLRVLCASAIAFVVCVSWAITFGRLTIMEYVGRMLWSIVGCGVFAAIVLAIIFPRKKWHRAAA